MSKSTIAKSLDIPHALEAWDDILPKLKEGKLVIFLDYDGTLTPIVSNPEDAIMSSDMRECIYSLSQSYVSSIVTGRNLDTITSFVQLDHIHYAASHGFVIRMVTSKEDENGKTFQYIDKHVGSEFVDDLQQVYQTLSSQITSTNFPGATIEDNHFSLSIHFRNVNPSTEECISQIESIIDSSLSSYNGRLIKTHGKKVFEVRPNLDWHKGKAVKYLLSELGKNGDIDEADKVVSMYIGDDVTDEDAFKCLSSDQDLLIVVTAEDRPTHANYRLEDPQDVLQFLTRLSNLNK